MAPQEENNGTKPREWRGRWEWLKQEFAIDKRFIPIKCIVFLFTGGVVAFIPYLTLHMQQLGLSVEEIAIMYAVLPAASLLGPPVTGMIADRFGKYNVMFIVNIVLTGVFHTLLLQVPPVPLNPITFQCDEGGHSLAWEKCDDCHYKRNNTQAELLIRFCEFDCPNPPNELRMCLANATISTCTSYNTTDKINLNGTLFTSLMDPEVCSHTWRDLQYEGQTYTNLTCDSACKVTCKVFGDQQCHLMLQRKSPAVTFWSYFVLRLIGTFFLGSSFTMMDAVTLAQIKEHGGEFGKQRVMTMVGFSVIPLIAGIIIDRIGEATGVIDYMPAFYLGDALLFFCVILVSRLRLDVEMPDESLTKGLKEIIMRVEIDIFMILILIMGTNYGFIESYLFVYLKELNAPNYLLGLTMTVGCMISIPMLFWADPIVNWMGRHNVFLVSFLAYAVRMFGYAYISTPWMCFPFETLEVFTYQLMWVAAATYCPILAPKGLLATMTGIAGAMHYSFGKGLGAFSGGYLIASLGTSGAFKVFGVVAVFGAVFYFLVYHCYMKKLVVEKEKAYEAEKAEEDAKMELESPPGKDRRVSTFSRKSSLGDGRRLSVVDVLM